MAIVFTASLAAVLVLVGNLETLADTTVLLLLFVFVCVNAAVLVLRREPVEHEHFRAPTVVPVLGVLACVALIVHKAFDDLDDLRLRRRPDRARDRAVGDQPSSVAFSVTSTLSASAWETGQFSFAASAA